MLLNSRRFMKFLQDFKLPTLSLFISILSKVLQTSNLLSLFPPLPKLIILLFPNKGVGTSIFNIQIENYVWKIEPQMIRIRSLKRTRKKEGEGRSQLNGQWKVLMLDGQWKEKEKQLFIFSHFFPNKFYLNLYFFPLILRFYFTMVLRH